MIREGAKDIRGAQGLQGLHSVPWRALNRENQHGLLCRKIVLNGSERGKVQTEKLSVSLC